MNAFARQLYFELYKMFARKRTYIGFGAFVIVQITLLFILQLNGFRSMVRSRLSMVVDPAQFDYYYSGLTVALFIILLTFALLGALYLALVAGDIVAKEVEDGTMRMVLARPVSRLRVLAVKWAACSIYTMSLVLFLAGTALMLATLYAGGLGGLFIAEDHLMITFDTGEGLYRYVRAMLFLCLSAQVISTMALMFSCFRMKPAAATILTLSVLFLDFVVQNMPYFRDYRIFTISHHTESWMRTFKDAEPWTSILTSVLVLLALNLTFWIIGAARFCTRDLKV